MFFLRQLLGIQHPVVAFPFLVRGRSTALWSRDEAVADVRQIQRTIQEVGVDEHDVIINSITWSFKCVVCETARKKISDNTSMYGEIVV